MSSTRVSTFHSSHPPAYVTRSMPLLSSSARRNVPSNDTRFTAFRVATIPWHWPSVHCSCVKIGARSSAATAAMAGAGTGFNGDAEVCCLCCCCCCSGDGDEDGEYEVSWGMPGSDGADVASADEDKRETWGVERAALSMGADAEGGEGSFEADSEEMNVVKVDDDDDEEEEIGGRSGTREEDEEDERSARSS